MQDVSILIPTYNGESTLGALLERLQPLRREGVEVLAMDSGSKDGTLALLDSRSATPGGRSPRSDGYFLTGILICDACDAHMHGNFTKQTGQRSGERIRKYVCRNRCSVVWADDRDGFAGVESVVRALAIARGSDRRYMHRVAAAAEAEPATCRDHDGSDITRQARAPADPRDPVRPMRRRALAPGCERSRTPDESRVAPPRQCGAGLRR